MTSRSVHRSRLVHIQGQSGKKQQVRARPKLPGCRAAKLMISHKQLLKSSEICWWWGIKRPLIFHHFSHAWGSSSPCTSAILYLSFNHPAALPPFFSLLFFTPTRFTQNTFLSFILLPSRFLFLPPLFFLPLSVFWTFLLVLSISLHLASPPSSPPSLPLFPPLSPVMNESVCWVQFIFTEQGSAHCQSLSPSTSLSLR